eukprot:1811005-Amphidinium_carterae.1
MHFKAVWMDTASKAKLAQCKAWWNPTCYSQEQNHDIVHNARKNHDYKSGRCSGSINVHAPKITKGRGDFVIARIWNPRADPTVH